MKMIIFESKLKFIKTAVISVKTSHGLPPWFYSAKHLTVVVK